MIFELLKLCIEKDASDLYFKTGYPPILRIDGNMQQLTKMSKITRKDFDTMLDEILDDSQKTTFLKNHKLDFGYSFSDARFRVNLFKELRGGNAGFRIIPFKELTFDYIGLPQSAQKFAGKRSGLVLITGNSGTGKSTTLSSFITYINSNFQKNVITIESPIEYIFEDHKSLISQRQVGVDCGNFEEGIADALQSDCDVIFISELINAEEVEMCLQAAESGKLVFAIIQGNSSRQALDRFIKLCPKYSQNQIAFRLAKNLLGTISQTLIAKKSEAGRIAAYEVFINSANGKKIISERKLQLIPSLIDSSSSEGMISLDNYIINLVQSGKITKEEAIAKANSRSIVKQKLEALK